MAEQTDQLQKLIAIATDFKLSVELRTKAIELLGNVGTPEALITLFDLAANEQLTTEERDLALRYALSRETKLGR